MISAVLLLAGIGWLYFWLRGNWFAAILGMPIGGYLFLMFRAFGARPGVPFSGMEWALLIFFTVGAPAIPMAVWQGLAEDRARQNIRGITLRRQPDANFNG